MRGQGDAQGRHLPLRNRHGVEGVRVRHFLPHSARYHARGRGRGRGSHDQDPEILDQLSQAGRETGGRPEGGVRVPQNCEECHQTHHHLPQRRPRVRGNAPLLDYYVVPDALRGKLVMDIEIWQLFKSLGLIGTDNSCIRINKRDKRMS